MAATRTVFIDTDLPNYATLAAQYDASIFNVVMLDNASPASEQIQHWLASHPDGTGINVVTPSDGVTGLFTPRVVFVDPSVADIQTVIAGVPANATVVVLDASIDGVQQIQQYLAANDGLVAAIDIVTDLASVDVVSHGSPGEVMLGSTVLNTANLADYSSQLAAIGSHLAEGADVLLYGCDVASGTVGQEFISALADATGADVAASNDLTGSTAAGGDWVLEAATGTIETSALNIAGYDGLLDAATAITSVSLSSDTGKPGDFITSTVTQTITGSFTASTNGNSTPSIYVSTNGGSSRTMATVKYTDNAGNGTFSVTIDLVPGSGRSIQFWSGLNGNNEITGAKPYTLEAAAPTTSISTLALSNDTGASASDFVTNTAAQSINGTLSAALAAGEVVRVSLDNGTSWQNATVSQTSFSLSGVTLPASGTMLVRVEDANGKAGPARSQAYVVDTAAPTPGPLTISGLTDSGQAGDGITNDRSFTMAMTANDPLASLTYEVSYNGGAFTATSAAPANLADGSYQFRGRATDVAGNSATTGIFNLTVDATAPNAPSFTGVNATPTNNATPTLGIAAEADTTVEVLRDGVVVGTATQTAPHSGLYTFTSSSLADGSFSFTARARDVAGNTSAASVSQTLVIDTTLTAPSVALESDTGTDGDGLTRLATLTFNTADSDAVRVIKVDGGLVDHYDAAGLADGSHTVSVTDTDGAGNTKSATVTFTLDTTLTAPTVALKEDTGANGDALTRLAALEFNTADSDATRVIKVDGDVVDHYDAAALADGNHTVSVTDTDGAGNTKNASVTFTLDTTLTAPTVALKEDTGTNGDALTRLAALEFNTADSDATRIIKVDGDVVDHYDAAGLADGSHTVSVTDTDRAGNTKNASVTFTLDTTLTAPTVALKEDTGASDDGLTRLAALDFNVADSDATRVIKVDGNVVDHYDAAALADGSHTVSVTDTDGAGNTKNASVTFTLDTTLTAPTVALTTDTGDGNDGLTKLANLTFNNADSDAKRVITVDGTVVQSYDPAVLADGTHTVTVTDTDGAANSKSTSTTFTLDTTGPVFTSSGTASIAENAGTNQVVYTAKATDTHGFAYTLSGTDAARFDISANGVVTLKDNPNYEAVNAYDFTVVATDAAGNHTDQAVKLAVTNVNEAPLAAPINLCTIENSPVSFQIADFASDPDIGDKTVLSINTGAVTLKWANTDPTAATALINPVTRAAVDLSTLSFKAVVSPDGASVTLTPPTELDWLVTGQVLKASFNYTMTDAGGLSSSDAIMLTITGSTSDKGVMLNGGNGNDTLAGNVSNNAEDVLQGANGNDTLSGYGGTDALYGGNGDDNLSGGAGIDYLYGDSGNDTLDGGTEGDYLFGGKGNDILTGWTGADKFVFEPQSGNDRIMDFKLAEGDRLYFADFFPNGMTAELFIAKYVADIGNDLLITLPGATITLVGVSSTEGLAGALGFAMPN